MASCVATKVQFSHRQVNRSIQFNQHCKHLNQTVEGLEDQLAPLAISRSAKQCLFFSQILRN